MKHSTETESRGKTRRDGKTGRKLREENKGKADV